MPVSRETLELLREIDESPLRGLPGDVTSLEQVPPIDFQARLGAVDPLEAALKQTPQTRLQVSPEGFGPARRVRNESSNYWDMTPEKQREINGLLQLYPPEFLIQQGLINEPPFSPFGSTAGFTAEFARGVAGAPSLPTPGASPIATGLGRLGGEAAKYIGLTSLLGGGVAGLTAAGAVSGVGREVFKPPGEFDPEAVAIEAGVAGLGGALFGAVGAGLKAAPKVVTGQPTKTPIPKPTVPIEPLPNTPEIAATMGYNPTVFKSLQTAWQKRVIDPMTQWVSGPTPSGVRAILKEKRVNQFFGREEAKKVAAQIDDLVTNKEDGEALFRFLDPDALGPGGKPMPPEFTGLATKIRNRINDLGADFVNEGILTPEKYLENFGKYMRRYYPQWEKLKEAARGKRPGRSVTKMVGDAFKRRTLKTPEERLAKNIITDPRYVVSRAIGDMTFDLETARALRRIAENPKWMQPASAFKTTADAAKKNFVHMPPDTRFGKLAGQWVQRDVADEIFALSGFTHGGKESLLSGFYDMFLQNWKYGKTALNPATHFRNIFSNTILADAGGGPQPWRWDIYSKAFKDYTKKSGLYDDAAAEGLFGMDWIGAELGKVLTPDIVSRSGSMFDVIASVSAKAYKKPGQIYQAEEHLFKFADYIYQRGKGLSSGDAAAHAQRTLFDYSDISPALQRWRRSPFGGPFLTFTAKAAPAMAEAAVMRPWRFWKYPIMLKAMHEYSKVHLGINDEEYKSLIASLPPWKQNGLNILIPWRSADDNYAFIDLTWNMPWGQIGENSSLLKLIPGLQNIPATGILDAFVGSNPALTVPVDIITGQAQFTGKPLFARGAGIDFGVDTEMAGDIVPRGLGGVATEKVAKHVARQLSPGFLLSVGPIMDVISGKEPDPIMTTLNKVFGIRIDDIDQKRGLDIKASQMKKQYKAVLTEAFRAHGRYKDDKISKEELDREIERLKNLAIEIGVNAQELKGFAENISGPTKKKKRPTMSKETLELLQDLRQ